MTHTEEDLQAAAVVAFSYAYRAQEGRRVQPEKLGGGVQPASQNLTLFNSKIWHFPDAIITWLELWYLI